MSKTAIIIPARFNSSRFPGKSLELIDEFNVIQSVYLRAQKVRNIDEVIVATDDIRILKSIEDVRGRVILTDKTHDNGTSRIAEVAEELNGFHFIINLQGDEPFVLSEDIEILIAELKNNDSQIVTLMKECSSEELFNPNVVKVKAAENGKALSFCRSYNADEIVDDSKKYKHLGIYGFNREVLLDLVRLEPTDSERIEKLEQLRWLDHGYAIQLIETRNESIGIDVPDDLIKARAFSKSLSQLH